MKIRRIMIKAGMIFAVLLAGLQSGITAPFCVVSSLNFGTPDCTFRTWAQCRASLGGVGDYCEPNTRGPYVFDLRDPANPRVVQSAPGGKFRTRH